MALGGLDGAQKLVRGMVEPRPDRSFDDIVREYISGLPGASAARAI
jgi:hypothetical protein